MYKESVLLNSRKNLVNTEPTRWKNVFLCRSLTKLSGEFGRNIELLNKELMPRESMGCSFELSEDMFEAPEGMFGTYEDIFEASEDAPKQHNKIPMIYPLFSSSIIFYQVPSW